MFIKMIKLQICNVTERDFIIKFLNGKHKDDILKTGLVDSVLLLEPAGVQIFLTMLLFFRTEEDMVKYEADDNKDRLTIGKDFMSTLNVLDAEKAMVITFPKEFYRTID